MRAIQISSFGNPTDVLTLIDAPQPPQPGPNEALLQVEYAPINVNDLLLIKGTFHYTPSQNRRLHERHRHPDANLCCRASPSPARARAWQHVDREGWQHHPLPAGHRDERPSFR
jgi:hypothetical protein